MIMDTAKHGQPLEFSVTIHRRKSAIFRLENGWNISLRPQLGQDRLPSEPVHPACRYDKKNELSIEFYL